MEKETIKYSENDLKRGITKLTDEIKREANPDLVIGLSKGGVVPAVFLSNSLKLPLYTVYPDPANIMGLYHQLAKDLDIEEILICDEICDSGKTLFLFEHTWESCNVGRYIRWSTATLLHNTAQELHDTTFTAQKFSRNEEERWFEFFWETPTI